MTFIPRITQPIPGAISLFIATIVVGLIIAVGLEQTVEAVHRHHERVELEERLHREAEDNIAPLETGRVSWKNITTWSASVVSLLRTTPERAGVVTLSLPTYESAGSETIQRAVWSLAKANGTLTLLPASEAEVFDRVDWWAEQADVAFRSYQQTSQEEAAAEAVAGVSLTPGTTVHFAESQREGLIRSMAKLQTTEAAETRWFTACEAANMAIRENPSSAVDLQRREHRISTNLRER